MNKKFLFSFKSGISINFVIMGLSTAIIFFLLFTFPIFKPIPPKELLIDSANIIDLQTEKDIVNYHRKLLADHDIDYRVLTVNGKKNFNVYANIKFLTMKVGENSKTGRGLLLAIDPLRNRIRLEVSASLEDVYTDTFVSYIQKRQMVHFFKTNRILEGIMATTELILDRAQKAEQGEEFSPPEESSSTGAGVEIDAQVGDGVEVEASVDADEVDDNQKIAFEIDAKQELTPEDVVNAYHEAMSKKDASPDLPIYSKKTVEMLTNQKVTPEQMENAAEEMTRCTLDKSSISGDFAVVRYPVEERTCAPYFLIRENGEWKLNMTMMQNEIRFNHKNQWHFDMHTASEVKQYGFAFTDWWFDKNGFPHPRDN